MRHTYITAHITVNRKHDAARRSAIHPAPKGAGFPRELGKIYAGDNMLTDLNKATLMHEYSALLHTQGSILFAVVAYAAQQAHRQYAAKDTLSLVLWLGVGMAGFAVLLGTWARIRRLRALVYAEMDDISGA